MRIKPVESEQTMNRNKNTTPLIDAPVNVKVVLAALWVAVMLLYLYVDHFALFIPGVLADIGAGKMGPLPATQGSLLAAMVLMTIPSLMVVLSLILKAKANRWTNIVVAGLYVVVVIGNIIGESWAFYLFGSAVEVALLALVIGYAARWPAHSPERAL
jgi:hypothetical protein